MSLTSWERKLQRSSDGIEKASKRKTENEQSYLLDMIQIAELGDCTDTMLVKNSCINNDL